jgi:WD40 repeat protein
MQHYKRVLAVAFNHDGKKVVTASEDGTARLWSAFTGEPIGRPLPHQGKVRVAIFDPGDRMVLTGSDDRTARLWDPATGRLISPPLLHRGVVATIAFSPDGRTILTGSTDKFARLSAVSTPLKGEVSRIVLWTQSITGMEFDVDGIAHVLKPRDWQERHRVLQEMGGPP